MLFQAEILAHQEEGTLERILRICRHRKFAIFKFSAAVDRERALVRIQLEGESERPFILLARQLEKLLEVVEVAAAAPRCELLPKAKARVKAEAIETRPYVGQVRRTVYASSSQG